MLDRASQRERARCLDATYLRGWLAAALRYVHVQMQLAWIEEENLADTRAMLQAFRHAGVFNVPEGDPNPTFVYNGTTWRVDPNGATGRLVETLLDRGLSVRG